MGSKPKQKDYQPSEADKANAAVAMAEKKYFNQQYAPLLREKRDASLSDDPKRIARRLANADTMQTLTGDLNYRNVAQAEGAGERGAALNTMLSRADALGQDVMNKEQMEVLGMARGQASDAMSGMSRAGDIGTTSVLADADAKQRVRSARASALGEIGTALVLQGGENKEDGLTFFGRKKA